MLGVLLVWYATHVALTGRPTDFDQVWAAGRAALAGRDAYAEIGPGRPFEWQWRFFYPMTAPVVVAPLLALPVAWARYVFIFVSSALLGWAVTRDHWRLLPLFLGGPFVINGLACQWSALVTAAICLPRLAWIIAAKPNFVPVLLATRLSRTTAAIALLGSTLAFAVSLAVTPGWIQEWIELARLSASSGNTSMLLLAPGGAVALLALLRWRRPEARLIAAMLFVPMSLAPYSFLPLALVPSTLRQSLVLAILTWGAFLVPFFGERLAPEAGGMTSIALVYLAFMIFPALLLVLCRPNVGPLPAWCERGVQRLPAMLRGHPGAETDAVVEARD